MSMVRRIQGVQTLAFQDTQRHMMISEALEGLKSLPGKRDIDDTVAALQQLGS